MVAGYRICHYHTQIHHGWCAVEFCRLGQWSRCRKGSRLEQIPGEVWCSAAQSVDTLATGRTQSETGHQRGVVWQWLLAIASDGATGYNHGQGCPNRQSVLDPVPEYLKFQGPGCLFYALFLERGLCRKSNTERAFPGYAAIEDQ